MSDQSPDRLKQVTPYRMPAWLLIRGGCGLLAFSLGAASLVVALPEAIWHVTDLLWYLACAIGAALVLIGSRQFDRTVVLEKAGRREHKQAMLDRRAATLTELRAEAFALLYCRWTWWTDGPALDYGVVIEFASLYVGNRRKITVPIHRVRVIRSQDGQNHVFFHERESEDNLGTAVTLMMARVPLWLRPRLVR